MQKGFFLSLEIAIAIGILVTAGGGLIFLTGQQSLFENNLQSQQTRAMIQTQTKTLTGQNLQGPQPPQNYYCYKALGFNPSEPNAPQTIIVRFNCETDSTLSGIKTG